MEGKSMLEKNILGVRGDWRGTTCLCSFLKVHDRRTLTKLILWFLCINHCIVCRVFHAMLDFTVQV